MKDAPGAEKAFLTALADDPKARRARFDFAKFLAQQGRPLEALKLLNGLVAEKPDDAPAWQFGGQIALGQPEFLEFAGNWTREAIKHFPEHFAIALQRAEALLLGGQPEAALPFWTKAHAANSPRQLAALTLCEFLAGECRQPFTDADEPAVSREFLKWYRQLIKVNAYPIVGRINEKLELLRMVLPSAAASLETAMKKAAEPAAA
jgi:tetratricopeptide (TPR) repeat protein